MITVDSDGEIAELNEEDNQTTVSLSLPPSRPSSTIDPLPCSSP